MKTLLSRLASLFALFALFHIATAADARTARRQVERVQVRSAAPANAEPSLVAVPQQVSTHARPALWLVSDHDTKIYLFGTVHALPKGIGWFEGSVAEAFEQSQELVTEILESDPAQMQSAVLTKAVLPPGKTLRELMTPANRTAYEAALKAYGLPEASFDKLKPWYVAVYLSAMPVINDGFDPANGVEQGLNARAKQKAHQHSALETAEYQLGLFDSLPQDVQLRYLAEVIETMPKARNELTAMVDAWKRGDAETLARLMNEDESEPELTQKLLIDRNRTWADWIKARLDKPGTVFMAVGAGHLAGNGSVQQQLEAKGITNIRVQ